MKQNADWDLTSGCKNYIAMLTKFLCPTHSEAKKVKRQSLERGKAYCKVMQGKRGVSCSKKICASQRISESIFKSWMREEKGSQGTCSARARFPGWLMARARGGVTGLTFSPQTLRGLGLSAHGHQVANLFHLVGGVFSQLQNNSGNLHKILLYRYF